MNQPTREEFEAFKAEIREEVKQLKEQQTEPIKVSRLEIQMHGARADILQIRESQADLRDRLIEHGEDLKAIKDKQDAHSDVLGQLVNIGERHTGSFDEIKATQDVHSRKLDEQAAMLQEILNRLPPS
jgi:hypothetical protein